MNAKSLKTAVAVLAVAAMPAVIAAQPMKDNCPWGVGPGPGAGMSAVAMTGMGPGWGMGSGWMMGMMGADMDGRPLISDMLRVKEKLGLSAEQETKLNELRTGYEKEAIKAHAEMKTLGVDLANVLGADKVDLAKAEEVIRKQEAQHSALRVARLKVLEAGKAVLTPEQQAAFKKILEETPPFMGPGYKRHEMRKDRMRRPPAAKPAPAEKEAPASKPM